MLHQLRHLKVSLFLFSTVSNFKKDFWSHAKRFTCFHALSSAWCRAAHIWKKLRWTKLHYIRQASCIFAENMVVRIQLTRHTSIWFLFLTDSSKQRPYVPTSVFHVYHDRSQWHSRHHISRCCSSILRCISRQHGCSKIACVGVQNVHIGVLRVLPTTQDVYWLKPRARQKNGLLRYDNSRTCTRIGELTGTC